jgi:bifunctional DNase/RNase
MNDTHLLEDAQERNWCQLSVEKVVVRPDREDQLLFLRQVGGDVVFPIAVGLYEAAAVKGALDTPVSSRPLTHELVFSAVKALGGRIRYALIDTLLSGVFYAKLAIRTPDGGEADLDCRPSDAVCVAYDAGVPVFTTRELLETVSSGA